MSSKMEAIRVFGRIRHGEGESGGPSCLRPVPGASNGIQLIENDRYEASTQYFFDRIYGLPNSDADAGAGKGSNSQAAFFEGVKEGLGGLFMGENVSILAYGPSGSGKSHTQIGPPGFLSQLSSAGDFDCDGTGAGAGAGAGAAFEEHAGVIPRVVRHIFDVSNEWLKASKKTKVAGQDDDEDCEPGVPLPPLASSFDLEAPALITVELMQVYNEELTDLQEGIDVEAVKAKLYGKNERNNASGEADGEVADDDFALRALPPSTAMPPSAVSSAPPPVISVNSSKLQLFRRDVVMGGIARPPPLITRIGSFSSSSSSLSSTSRAGPGKVPPSAAPAKKKLTVSTRAVKHSANAGVALIAEVSEAKEGSLAGEGSHKRADDEDENENDDDDDDGSSVGTSAANSVTTLSELASTASVGSRPRLAKSKNASAAAAVEAFVPGAINTRVSSPAEVFSLFGLALAKRATAATFCNADSSRSHFLFTIRLEMVLVPKAAAGGDAAAANGAAAPKITLRSKCVCADLAGSESVGQSLGLGGLALAAFAGGGGAVGSGSDAGLFSPPRSSAAASAAIGAGASSGLARTPSRAKLTAPVAFSSSSSPGRSLGHSHPRLTEAETETRRKEAGGINKSLLAVGNVVSALAALAESTSVSVSVSVSTGLHRSNSAARVDALTTTAATASPQRSGATGTAMKRSNTAENSSIMRSAGSSGSCPTPAFVPYRDSVLTRYLQDVLGGNATTTIIVTASALPQHAKQAKNALEFGKRAKMVRCKPVANVSLIAPPPPALPSPLSIPSATTGQAVALPASSPKVVSTTTAAASALPLEAASFPLFDAAPFVSAAALELRELLDAAREIAAAARQDALKAEEEAAGLKEQLKAEEERRQQEAAIHAASLQAAVTAREDQLQQHHSQALQALHDDHSKACSVLEQQLAAMKEELLAAQARQQQQEQQTTEREQLSSQQLQEAQKAFTKQVMALQAQLAEAKAAKDDAVEEAVAAVAEEAASALAAASASDASTAAVLKQELSRARQGLLAHHAARLVVEKRMAQKLSAQAKVRLEATTQTEHIETDTATGTAPPPASSAAVMVPLTQYNNDVKALCDKLTDTVSQFYATKLNTKRSLALAEEVKRQKEALALSSSQAQARVVALEKQLREARWTNGKISSECAELRSRCDWNAREIERLRKENAETKTAFALLQGEMKRAEAAAITRELASKAMANSKRLKEERASASPSSPESAKDANKTADDASSALLLSPALKGALVFLSPPASSFSDTARGQGEDASEDAEAGPVSSENAPLAGQLLPTWSLPPKTPAVSNAGAGMRQSFTASIFSPMLSLAAAKAKSSKKATRATKVAASGAKPSSLAAGSALSIANGEVVDIGIDGSASVIEAAAVPLPLPLASSRKLRSVPTASSLATSGTGTGGDFSSVSSKMGEGQE